MDNREKKIEQRFMDDIQNHQMKIIRDDGINRHIVFKRPNTSAYYFELITWPGKLLISGDCGTWVFARTEDMFDFFRTDRHDFNFNREGGLSINSGYWAEKLQAVDNNGRTSGPMEFSESIFKRIINERVKDQLDPQFYDNNLSAEQKAELWERIRDDLFSAETEEDAHRRVSEFECHGIRFQDFWEARCTQYTQHYIWNLFAIVWGIRQYDASKAQMAEAAA